MPSNVVHVSASTYISVVYTVAYPIFLLPLDNGAFLQSDVQSCSIVIRNNMSWYMSRKKKTWILITQTYHTAKLLSLSKSWNGGGRRKCAKKCLHYIKTVHKKRKHISQEKNNDRHKFARILSYMLARFLHGLLEIQRVSRDTKIRHCFQRVTLYAPAVCV